MKIVLSHPFGNANTRAAVMGMHRLGLLDSFHTCIACFKGSLLYRLSALKAFREFRRREFDAALRGITRVHPWKEMGRQAAMKLKLSSLTGHETDCFCVDNVCRDLDKKVARYLARHKDAVAGVYTYEDMALDTFSVAKKNHLKCLYDLPTGYWRAKEVYFGEEKVKKTIEELGKELLDLTIEVANGKQTKSEALGFMEIAIARVCNYV